MIYWARTPLQFLFLGVIGGAVFGVVVFGQLLGMEENRAILAGMAIFCPIAVVWELRWRNKSRHQLGDVKVASLFSFLPTWVVTGGLFIIALVVFSTDLFKAVSDLIREGNVDLVVFLSLVVGEGASFATQSIGSRNVRRTGKSSRLSAASQLVGQLLMKGMLVSLLFVVAIRVFHLTIEGWVIMAAVVAAFGSQGVFWALKERKYVGDTLAFVLGQIDDVELWLRMLKSWPISPLQGIQLIQYLGLRRDPRAIGPLKELADNNLSLLRPSAAKALGQISGNQTAKPNRS